MAQFYRRQFARIDETIVRQRAFLERPFLSLERRSLAQRNLVTLMYRRDAVFGEFTRAYQNCNIGGTTGESASCISGETPEASVSNSNDRQADKKADPDVKDVNKERAVPAGDAQSEKDGELNDELEESFPGSDAPSATRRSEKK